MKVSKKAREADKELYKLGRSIEILSKLNWPVSYKNKFLNGVKKGRPVLPSVNYKVKNYSDKKEALQSIIKHCSKEHPVENLIRETASSFYTAMMMLESIGTPDFLKYSKDLYGTPKDAIAPGGITALDAAKKHLHAVKEFDLDSICPPTLQCILPSEVASKIGNAALETFGEGVIKIKLCKRLKSKASASYKTVKVREGTCFSEYDINQLVQHELYIHCLTLINGRKQKIKTLGLNSPRTTCSQEGLAVFSEFITGAIDVVRLRRVSARVCAIDMALQGADFIEVFYFFKECGQSDEEAYYSAARVFRGGNVNGRIVFTKDIVYLQGFIKVHHFFYKALKEREFDRIRYFVAGRLDVDDIAPLEPFFKSQKLKYPTYEPQWLNSSSSLLAFLLSSFIMNNLGLSQLEDYGGIA